MGSDPFLTSSNLNYFLVDFQTLKLQSKVHFIGLGGIGMSALAFILRKWNIEVQGSDLSENYLTPKLREAGATYFVGHDAKNITDDVPHESTHQQNIQR